MSRYPELTVEMGAALEEPLLIPAFFVELEIASGGVVRMWSGLGDYYWPVSSPAGQVWKGVGSLGEISSVGETTDTNAIGITLTLSGIPAGMVTDALDELIPGKTATIWLALFDAASAVIVDPYKTFAGRIDAVDMEEGGDTCRVIVNAESLLIGLQVLNEYRWVEQDQKIDYPDDTGFNLMEQLQELNINWGAATQPIPQTNN